VTTHDRLTFTDCTLKRDPLIQLTGIAPTPGLSGHFRGVTLTNSFSSERRVVDFGGGPRTRKTEHPVRYYFHGSPTPGAVTRVTSTNTAEAMRAGNYRGIDEWTGPEARATAVQGIAFPQLLAPVDDEPPATLITSIALEGAKRIVRGISHDNGEIATISVNGRPATIITQHAGVADWTITFDAPAHGRYLAQATDRAGNAEHMPHEVIQPVP